ncbi:MAG: 2-C-methyl-D-erythritol 4-phosphate cytidylyltransferase [Chitinispirillales bacterium]|jgi:2-C-methyl-D-erythritol 4-phosphate cytidylyltransferase|nr:2-C-methyl-D-erythritol 4-phosphate cytidylyltransferase [Chitinispirillales bacterium]
MNIALIIAGGTGKRTQQEIPKQFINVHDKPILLYTLGGFQKHPDIHAIAVVCLNGWQEILAAYTRQFDISKLKWVVDGGDTGQESIRNGVFELYKHGQADDIVIIHDGIRPLIDMAVLSDCITVCKEHGNAVSSLPYNEQIFKTSDGLTTTEYIPRETLRRVQTPQAYTLGKLYQSYKEAFEKEIGIYGSSYTNTMMVELGETLHFAAGSDKNIKITTADDIQLFKALLKMETGN